jgi:hypothetical protein
VSSKYCLCTPYHFFFVTDAQVIVLNQTLDKFGQRWRALKPTDLKDWASDEVAKVFTALDDWQAQVLYLKNSFDSIALMHLYQRLVLYLAHAVCLISAITCTATPFVAFMHVQTLHN